MQGYPQHPGYPPQYPQYPPPPKKGISGWGVVGIVTLCLFGGCMTLCVVGGKGASDKAAADKASFEKEEALEVTSQELLEAYEANEVGADAKFKGKKLRITGVVNEIASGIGDEPDIRLEGGKMFKHVTLQGVSKTDAARLKKGQKIVAVCKGNGEIIGTPFLKNCALD